MRLSDVYYAVKSALSCAFSPIMRDKWSLSIMKKTILGLLLVQHFCACFFTGKRRLIASLPDLPFGNN
jgi:hypothetical protein